MNIIQWVSDDNLLQNLPKHPQERRMDDEIYGNHWASTNSYGSHCCLYTSAPVDTKALVPGVRESVDVPGVVRPVWQTKIDFVRR
jgi:hypothetical protein